MINGWDIARKVRTFTIGLAARRRSPSTTALAFFNDVILKPFTQTMSGHTRCTARASDVGFESESAPRPRPRAQVINESALWLSVWHAYRRRSSRHLLPGAAQAPVDSRFLNMVPIF